jgi:hypothetical protein
MAHVIVTDDNLVLASWINNQEKAPYQEKAGQKKMDYEKSKAKFDKKVILVTMPSQFYNQSLLCWLCPDLSSIFPSGEHELKKGKD